jgi:8-oxo-dGTP diphosphatase
MVLKKIEVVAAIIIHNDEILCVQRPENKLDYISKKFEFPGGKIEKDETKIEVLKRELIEELEIEPSIGRLFLTVNHTYPDFDLTMYSYICVSKTKEIDLKEHLSAQWLTKERLNILDWAAADIPIIEKLIQNG